MVHTNVRVRVNLAGRRTASVTDRKEGGIFVSSISTPFVRSCLIFCVVRRRKQSLRRSPARPHDDYFSVIEWRIVVLQPKPHGLSVPSAQVHLTLFTVAGVARPRHLASR